MPPIKIELEFKQDPAKNGSTTVEAGASPIYFERVDPDSGEVTGIYTVRAHPGDDGGTFSYFDNSQIGDARTDSDGKHERKIELSKATEVTNIPRNGASIMDIHTRLGETTVRIIHTAPTQ